MRTQQRTISIVGKPDADSCSVNIAEEGITLEFQRNAGVVQCIGRMLEHPDNSPRASRDGFTQARKAAIQKMNELQQGEKVRSDMEEPRITNSSVVECSMSYAGNEYSFACRVDLPLTWSNLHHAATFLGKNGEKYISDGEWHKLRQRAFTRIKLRREQSGHYGPEGLRPFIETDSVKLAPELQLSFVL